MKLVQEAPGRLVVTEDQGPVLLAIWGVAVAWLAVIYAVPFLGLLPGQGATVPGIQPTGTPFPQGAAGMGGSAGALIGIVAAAVTSWQLAFASRTTTVFDFGKGRIERVRSGLFSSTTDVIAAPHPRVSVHRRRDGEGDVRWHVRVSTAPDRSGRTLSFSAESEADATAFCLGFTDCAKDRPAATAPNAP